MRLNQRMRQAKVGYEEQRYLRTMARNAPYAVVVVFLELNEAAAERRDRCYGFARMQVQNARNVRLLGYGPRLPR